MATTPPPVQLNAALTAYGFTAAVQQQLVNLEGASILQKLVTAIGQSALLQDMFSVFTGTESGTIVLGAVDAGIKSDFDNPTGQAKIYIGLSELKNVLASTNAVDNLADVLAHELDHMTMTSGHPGTAIPSNCGRPESAQVPGFDRFQRRWVLAPAWIYAPPVDIENTGATRGSVLSSSRRVGGNGVPLIGPL